MLASILSIKTLNARVKAIESGSPGKKLPPPLVNTALINLGTDRALTEGGHCIPSLLTNEL